MPALRMTTKKTRSIVNALSAELDSITETLKRVQITGRKKRASADIAAAEDPIIAGLVEGLGAMRLRRRPNKKRTDLPQATAASAYNGPTTSTQIPAIGNPSSADEVHPSLNTSPVCQDEPSAVAKTTTEAFILPPISSLDVGHAAHDSELEHEEAPISLRDRRTRRKVRYEPLGKTVRPDKVARARIESARAEEEQARAERTLAAMPLPAVASLERRLHSMMSGTRTPPRYSMSMLLNAEDVTPGSEERVPSPAYAAATVQEAAAAAQECTDLADDKEDHHDEPVIPARHVAARREAFKVSGTHKKRSSAAVYEKKTASVQKSAKKAAVTHKRPDARVRLDEMPAIFVSSCAAIFQQCGVKVSDEDYLEIARMRQAELEDMPLEDEDTLMGSDDDSTPCPDASYSSSSSSSSDSGDMEEPYADSTSDFVGYRGSAFAQSKPVYSNPDFSLMQPGEYAPDGYGQWEQAPAYLQSSSMEVDDAYNPHNAIYAAGPYSSNAAPRTSAALPVSTDIEMGGDDTFYGVAYNNKYASHFDAAHGRLRRPMYNDYDDPYSVPEMI
ncbi:hypothetical protein BD626DRAFT_570667 [Schizophyllum amplum]|uniref:Uncharacterized protein n=1 Tax=Schizophyllum amplum TaxID=97359 RepID=A0A550C9H0_9AGAR|nr:hypothetical protein BD626DRAFT_570667 [Auriculariopsis ampla]